MYDRKVMRLVLTALLAALCCVATLVIQIPSPMNGYVNLGDCFVLLAGWILGPLWGFFAGGLGSMLADIMSGYTHYAPGTFLIKGATALIAALLYRLLSRKDTRRQTFSRLCSALVGESFMVLGYFGYACLLLGKGLAAAASIPGNLIQGLVGIVSSVVLMKIFSATPALRKTIHLN